MRSCQLTMSFQGDPRVLVVTGEMPADVMPHVIAIAEIWTGTSKPQLKMIARPGGFIVGASVELGRWHARSAIIPLGDST